jgi:hypothetical protein
MKFDFQKFSFVQIFFKFPSLAIATFTLLKRSISRLVARIFNCQPNRESQYRQLEAGVRLVFLGFELFAGNLQWTSHGYTARLNPPRRLLPKRNRRRNGRRR